MKKFINRKRKFVNRKKGFSIKPFPLRYSIPNPGALNISNRTEIKTLDVPLQTDLISTTAVFTLLNLMEEGTSFFNRVGRKIMMKSIRITGGLALSGLAVINANQDYLRVMVVYDRQPNGSAPAISDILQNVDLGGTSSTTSYAGLNMNNSERFLVIQDTRLNIPNGYVQSLNEGTASIIDYNGTMQNMDRFSKLKGLQTHFKGTAGSITDVASGALWLVTFGNIAPGTAPYNLIWNARLRYHDSA